MTVKQKCECEQICKYYGIQSQKIILMEECAELIFHRAEVDTAVREN